MTVTKTAKLKMTTDKLLFGRLDVLNDRPTFSQRKFQLPILKRTREVLRRLNHFLRNLISDKLTPKFS